MKYAIMPPQFIHEIGQRPKQEDSLYPQGVASVDDRLFILCDGMGGHEAGEVASATVCKAMSEYILSHHDPQQPFTDDMFKEALTAAYNALNASDATTDAEKTMGTTLAFLFLHRGGVFAAHIGDSRLYHVRPSEGRILWHSRDHSLVYNLFEKGELTEEGMKQSPQRNVITRCMMPHQAEPAQADIKHITDVKPGDYFYICSDGMLEKMLNKEIASIICDPDETDEIKALSLKKYTSDNHDNHSAWLIHIGEVTSEMSDRPVQEAEVKKEEEIKEKESKQEEDVTVVPQQKKKQPQPTKRTVIWPFLLLLGAALLAAALFLLPQKNVNKRKTPTKVEDFRSPSSSQAKKVQPSKPAAKTKQRPAAQRPSSTSPVTKTKKSTVSTPAKSEPKTTKQETETLYGNSSEQQSAADELTRKMREKKINNITPRQKSEESETNKQQKSTIYEPA